MRFVLRLAFTLSLAAQDPTFDVQSRVVSIPVTVTDKEGRLVNGLEPPDFVLLDKGRPVKTNVDSFATGVAPIALVVAVQSSGISAAVLVKVQKIGSMIQPLITGQRGCAALVSFAERVEWLQECTSDQDALARAFAKLEPGEERRARMLDAVHEATKRLRARRNVRKVLFLVSESRDRDSETDLESAVLAAEAAGVSVYAATYSAFQTAFTARPSDVERPPKPKGPPEPAKEQQSPRATERGIPSADQRVDLLAGLGELARLKKPNTTQILTGRTGGAVFAFHRQKGLEDAIEKLGTELHSQYLLSFIPDTRQPGFHRVDVQVTRRGDFRIRARPGYWSPQ
jgi:VWFA-related protein